MQVIDKIVSEYAARIAAYYFCSDPNLIPLTDLDEASAYDLGYHIGQPKFVAVWNENLGEHRLIKYPYSKWRESLKALKGLSWINPKAAEPKPNFDYTLYERFFQQKYFPQ